MSHRAAQPHGALRVIHWEGLLMLWHLLRSAARPVHGLGLVPHDAALEEVVCQELHDTISLSLQTVLPQVEVKLWSSNVLTTPLA